MKSRTLMNKKNIVFNKYSLGNGGSFW